METKIYVSDQIQKSYKKLSINELPEKVEIQSHQNSWNAHYFVIFGKRCWFLMHSITRYTAIIPDVKAERLNKFTILPFG